MRLMVSEVINKAAAMKDPNEQINFLIMNDSVPLRHVLKFGLDKNIEILLPSGDPPYKPSEAVESHGIFFSQARKMYLFARGGNDNLHPIKRETIFIQMLESVHPEDAKMLLLMKDKKIPLSVDIVNAAFPDLQIEPVVMKQEVVEADTTTKSKKGKKTFSPIIDVVDETRADIKASIQEIPVKRGRGRPKKAEAQAKAATN